MPRRTGPVDANSSDGATAGGDTAGGDTAGGDTPSRRNRPSALLGSTVYLLSQIARHAKLDLDGRLAERGMRLRHMALLATLADTSPSSQRDIARSLAMDPSDVTAVVDDLEGTGLVRRAVDPADRRRRLIHLTPAGRDALGELTVLAAEVADSVLAPLPDERRRRLRDDLTSVLAHTDEQAARRVVDDAAGPAEPRRR